MKDNNKTLTQRLNLLAVIKLVSLGMIMLCMLGLIGLAGAGDRGSVSLSVIIIVAIADFGAIGLFYTIIQECERVQSLIIKRAMRRRGAARAEIVELRKNIA